MTGKRDGVEGNDLVGGAAKRLSRFIEEGSKGLSRHIAALDKRVEAAVEPSGEEPVQKQGTTNVPKEHFDRALTLVDRLSSAPFVLGNVIAFTGGQEPDAMKLVRVASGGRIVEVAYPNEIELTIGATVRLNPATTQIVDLAEPFEAGVIATVHESAGEFVRVELTGALRTVYRGVAEKALARGDRVVLDESLSLIIRVLEKEAKNFALKRAPLNTLDDIVGHEEVILDLREAVSHNPLADAISRHYNRPRIKGVFLFGPPGCGKTMLGEGVAALIAEIYGKDAVDSGYIYVKGPELLEKYVGDAEKAIKERFEDAERHMKEYGYPAVMFWDEAESILSRRGSGRSSDMEKTMVPMFLKMMDETSAIVIVATNRPDAMDPAAIRDERFDRHVYVGRPTQSNAAIIIAKNLRKFPLVGGAEKESDLTTLATTMFFDPSRKLLDDALPLKNGGSAPFTLAHIVNGAMLKGFIKRASSIAERRDRKDGTLTGIGGEDLTQALNALFTEKKRLDHRDELREFVSSLKDQLDDGALRQKSIP